MSTSDMKKAREWAEDVRRIEAEYGSARPDALAGARIIESLPDTVVDGDKLREVINKVLANTVHGTVGYQVAEDYAALIGELIPAPSLPTLAELIKQGNDLRQYQWMQAEHIEHGRVIITHPGSTYIYYMKTSGLSGGVSYSGADHITPLPDLPRMEWPAQEPRIPETPPAETLNSPSSDTPRKTRPEDVPAGEPWLVKYDGHDWVGTRELEEETSWPWALARLDGADYSMARDSDITLVSRLVPEDKP